MERYRFNISDGDSFEHVGEGALLISCIKFSANNASQLPASQPVRLGSFASPPARPPQVRFGDHPAHLC